MSIDNLRKAFGVNDSQKQTSEEKRNRNEDSAKKVLAYSRTLNNLDKRMEVRDYNHFKRGFVKAFKQTTGTDLIVNQNNKAFLSAIAAYFYKDESFLTNPSVLNRPDFDKGLLISGSFGLGKSTIMEVMQNLGKGFKIDNMNYKIRSCNSIVTQYETLDSRNPQAEREFFRNLTKKNEIYFDDFGTEDIASRFGKKELMKSILEERYSSRVKTHVTTNLTMQEISDRYGERVADRIPEMFNLIKIEGESFRN